MPSVTCELIALPSAKVEAADPAVDVVGTCFSYDNGAKGIEERLGPKLAKYGLTSKVVMYSVVCGTERDYSYLSQIGQYKQFHTIFFGIFRRVLFQLGVPPEDLDDDFLSKDDIDHIYKRYMDLQPRPGLAEMFQILREGGFDVWACSDASVERVRGYFKGANVPIADDHIISADVVGKGKPEAAVYKLAMEKVGGNTSDDVAVFAGTNVSVYLFGIYLTGSITRLGLCRGKGSWI